MKIESKILQELGPIPRWKGGEASLKALETMYKRAREKVKLPLDNQGQDMV